jgi:ribosomal protein S18 acetylase RimI-like enzyme
MQTSATIRRAGVHDVPAITNITKAAYTKWIAIIGREPMPMTVDYSAAINKNIFDLAEINGAPVGLIEMIDEGSYLMIENLAVLPAHQGYGLGKLLLQHAEQVAKAMAIPEIRLLTNAAFTSNIELYQQHHYVIDREEPFKGGTTVYMSKALDLA